jgi:hypothetical protein
MGRGINKTLTIMVEVCHIIGNIEHRALKYRYKEA